MNDYVEDNFLKLSDIKDANIRAPGEAKTTLKLAQYIQKDDGI